MPLNCLKVGCTVTLLKYLASIVSLIFLLKTLILNKIMFPASNLLNFAELVEIELTKCISKKTYRYLTDKLLSALLLLIVKILRAYNRRTK